MNNVRELRKKMGIQQKELALEVGVSNATVSDWEHGRKNPSGERLTRLAEFFGVDKQTVLGQGETVQLNTSSAVDQKTNGLSETEQIIEHVLKRLNVPTSQPQTNEARMLAIDVDKMPQEQREQALNIIRTVFAKYIKNGDDAHGTT